MTPKPSRRFSNAVGRFSYQHLPLRYYVLSQTLQHNQDGLGFLIASPTKALCDRLILSRQLPLLSRADMRDWLLEDLRIDEDEVAKLSLAEMDALLAVGYKRRQLGTLRAVIAALQQARS